MYALSFDMKIADLEEHYGNPYPRRLLRNKAHVGKA